MPAATLAPARLSARLAAWRTRLIAAPEVQRLARRLPLLRGLARRDGERLFDLMAGFVYAQTLAASIELGLLDRLRAGPRTPAELGLDLPPARAEALCRAAAGIGLVEPAGAGRFRLGRLGAEALAVPGTAAMVRHHALLYRDLAAPAAFLRGGTQPEVAGFWSYVQGGEVGADEAAAYSALMAGTQALVAEEVLDALRLDAVRHLLDVGGGTGAFLAAVGRVYPEMRLTLFDLPAVVAQAPSGRIFAVGGDFRRQPLPDGADAISLVRVLYDHCDEVAAALLRRAAAALPPGGRIIVAEAMAGARPERFADTYFGLYTLAMGSGQVRTAARIGAMLSAAGFRRVRAIPTARPFIARVVTGFR
jgi:demethylspheroidene O-methyltransferase